MVQQYIAEYERRLCAVFEKHALGGVPVRQRGFACTEMHNAYIQNKYSHVCLYAERLW